jgi:hypothetical protein
MTNEAAKNILAMAAKRKEGSFKPSRERDALSVEVGLEGRISLICRHV